MAIHACKEVYLRLLQELISWCGETKKWFKSMFTYDHGPWRLLSVVARFLLHSPGNLSVCVGFCCNGALLKDLRSNIVFYHYTISLLAVGKTSILRWGKRFGAKNIAKGIGKRGDDPHIYIYTYIYYSNLIWGPGWLKFKSPSLEPLEPWREREDLCTGTIQMVTWSLWLKK